MRKKEISFWLKESIWQLEKTMLKEKEAITKDSYLRIKHETIKLLKALNKAKSYNYGQVNGITLPT